MTHDAIGRARRGTVSSFDEKAGLGTIAGGDDEWFFHCSSIADGTRVVPEGADVMFTLTPGHMGRLEARNIRPV